GTHGRDRVAGCSAPHRATAVAGCAGPVPRRNAPARRPARAASPRPASCRAAPAWPGGRAVPGHGQTAGTVVDSSAALLVLATKQLIQGIEQGLRRSVEKQPLAWRCLATQEQVKRATHVL